MFYLFILLTQPLAAILMLNCATFCSEKAYLTVILFKSLICRSSFKASFWFIYCISSIIFIHFSNVLQVLGKVVYCYGLLITHLVVSNHITHLFRFRFSAAFFRYKTTQLLYVLF